MMLKTVLTNARTQFRFHLFMGVFWVVQMPLIVILVIFYPYEWLEIGVIYIAEVSVWSVVATHLGGMSSALAAITSDTVEEDVSDIRDVMFQTEPELWRTN